MASINLEDQRFEIKRPINALSDHHPEKCSTQELQDLLKKLICYPLRTSMHHPGSPGNDNSTGFPREMAHFPAVVM